MSDQITIYIPGFGVGSSERRYGDAQIIHDEDKNAIVIDGGEPTICNKLIAYCKNKGITHVTYILSHWHYDHDIGMKAFLDVKGICVDKIYCPNPAELAGLGDEDAAEDRARAGRRLSLARSLGKTVIYPTTGKTTQITVGKIKCNIWRRAATKADKDDYEVNNTSMCCYFPDLYYLTTGDTINSFDIYLKTNPGPIRVFKIPHHGNACTTNPCNLLKAAGAKLCWYNDLEPKGKAIGSTGFSRYGAGYCKKYFVTLRTDQDIYMTASDGKLRVQKGTSTWSYSVPYKGEKSPGWHSGGGKKWYILDDGTFATGWKQIDGIWYYFNPDSGIMLTGWYYDKGLAHWYYLDPSTGAMTKNKPLKVDGFWYFFDGYGQMRTGWYEEPNIGLHYLEPEAGKNQGHMYVNTTAEIDGKDWLFDGYGIASAMASDVVARVIRIAENEIGYKEKASNKDLDSKTANAGSANYTKYGRDMHSIYPKTMDFPAAWCDAFVDWCFYKAFGKEIAPQMLCGTFDDYTVNSANLYKKAGRWYTSPQIGDQIFFKDSNGICHTGLVYRVYEGKVYTVEGNKSNEVKYCGYALTDSKIAGYGRPKWELASKGMPVTKSVEELAYEVIDGKWGVGDIRKQLLTEYGYDYDAVQKRVNEILKK